MNSVENRRPLKARDWKIIQKGACWLGQKNVTPNQISLASIAFAALCGISLLNVGEHWLPSFMAVLFMLGRSLCNIWDGMVAIEGGKSTKSGELFNDMPDRVADSLILVAAGYATSLSALGWLAALLAVMTAYTRTLARSAGAPPDFRGPMSKVPRMAIVSAAALITPLVKSDIFLLSGLVIIAVGCVITIVNRARAAWQYLEGRPGV